MATSADRLLEALAAEGMTRLFGNPGSTELPLVAAASRCETPRYTLGLHEHVVMGMADGFAQASGGTAAVNLHVQPGIANAMAGILNASRARTPLLVTVGQQVTGMRDSGPFLGGDVLGPARPWAKWAAEADRADDVPAMLHTALAVAATPPCGPVVLSLPADVMAASAPPFPARPEAHGPAAPDAATLRRIAAAVNDARAPVVLAGDGVVHDGAADLVTRFAERIGAPIWGEPMGGRAPVPWGHPRWRGQLPPYAAAIAPLLRPHDLVIALGMPVFRLFGPSPGEPIPDGAMLIHIDADPEEVGRNHPPDLGLVGSVRAVLGAILPEVSVRDRSAAASHVTPPEPAEGRDIDPATVSAAIARAVTRDDVVVDESLTAGRPLRSMLRDREPWNWFAHRGSALGWGLPAAVGVRMAMPGRRVLALQGDGSLMFGVQALWSAAHERLGLATVVLDNGGYEILRAGMRGAFGPQAPWVGFDLERPSLDLQAICRGFGADTAGVDHADQLDDALVDLWERAEEGPAVLVVRVARGQDAIGYPMGVPETEGP